MDRPARASDRSRFGAIAWRFPPSSCHSSAGFCLAPNSLLVLNASSASNSFLPSGPFSWYLGTLRRDLFLCHICPRLSRVFISASGLYRMNPGGWPPHSYPCSHVMTSRIHVQRGQKQKRGMISCCFTAILQWPENPPDFERNRCRSSKSTSAASGCLCRHPWSLLRTSYFNQTCGRCQFNFKHLPLEWYSAI
jgi:hypothetical protein